MNTSEDVKAGKTQGETNARDRRYERRHSIDGIIQQVKIKASGRTRFEGQEPYWDEVLVAEVERLRQALRDIGNRKCEDATKRPDLGECYCRLCGAASFARAALSTVTPTTKEQA